MRRPQRTRRRGERGFTLLETLVAAVLLVFVLGAAIGLMRTTRGLSESVHYSQQASQRIDQALAHTTDALRQGSVATMTTPDGTAFDDGTTASGFTIRPVVGYSGTPTLGDAATIGLDTTTGELVRAEGLIQTVLARNIESFEISRDGNRFTVTAASSAGPDDDRRRSVSATVRVLARNP